MKNILFNFKSNRNKRGIYFNYLTSVINYFYYIIISFL